MNPAIDYQWRPWNAECPHCGDRAEVFTDTGMDNLANDGDKARCSTCHHPGSVVIGEEGTSCENYIAWEDD